MSSEQNLELTPTAVEGHGNTPAAWALVTLVMLGTLAVSYTHLTLPTKA